MENNSQADEINFEPFFHFLIKFLKTIIGFFANIVYTIKKNFIKIIVGSFLGAIMVTSIAYFMKPRYGLEMAVSSSFMSTHFFESELNVLQNLIAEKNIQLLSERLQISGENAQEIHGLKVVKFPISILPNDSVNNVENFGIQIEVYDNSISTALQNGILNYLENIPFGLKRKEQRKQNYITVIAKYENELITLDSLIAVSGKTIGPTNNSNGFIFGEPINPVSFLQRREFVVNQLLRCENGLELVNNIQLVRGITPLKKPIFPKKSCFAIVGFLLGFIIVFSITWKKK